MVNTQTGCVRCSRTRPQCRRRRKGSLILFKSSLFGGKYTFPVFLQSPGRQLEKTADVSLQNHNSRKYIDGQQFPPFHCQSKHLNLLWNFIRRTCRWTCRLRCLLASYHSIRHSVVRATDQSLSAQLCPSETFLCSIKARRYVIHLQLFTWKKAKNFQITPYTLFSFCQTDHQVTSPSVLTLFSQRW